MRELSCEKSSAMKLAIDFGINQMKLEKIWAATDQSYSVAIKFFTRLNFEKTNDLEDGEIEFELLLNK